VSQAEEPKLAEGGTDEKLAYPGIRSGLAIWYTAGTLLWSNQKFPVMSMVAEFIPLVMAC